MTIEVKVPELPESVADGVLLEWHKQVGELVSRDDNLVDIETDKVVLEIPAPDTGVIKKILKNNGDVVTSGEVLAIVDADATTVVPHQPSHGKSRPPPSFTTSCKELGKIRFLPKPLHEDGS